MRREVHRLRAGHLTDAHALEARADVQRRGLAGRGDESCEHRPNEHAEAGGAAHDRVGDREHAGPEEVVARSRVLDHHLPVREGSQEPVGGRLREPRAHRDAAEALRPVTQDEEHVGRARDGAHRTLILSAEGQLRGASERHGHQSIPTATASPSTENRVRMPWLWVISFT